MAPRMGAARYRRARHGPAREASRPSGFGLDDSAVRAAFALSFEPARDRSNRPTRSEILWPIDWPAFWWLIDRSGITSGPIPEEAEELPCAYNGPPTKVARACNEAPMAATLSAPWIMRPKVHV